MAVSLGNNHAHGWPLTNRNNDDGTGQGQGHVAQTPTPAPQTHPPTSTPASASASAPSQLEAREGPAPAQWQAVREEIRTLYEKRPLRDVRRILEQRHGFRATYVLCLFVCLSPVCDARFRGPFSMSFSLFFSTLSYLTSHPLPLLLTPPSLSGFPFFFLLISMPSPSDCMYICV